MGPSEGPARSGSRLSDPPTNLRTRSLVFYKERKPSVDSAPDIERREEEMLQNIS